MNMKKTMMTVKEAADYLGVSKDFIYKLVRQQVMPHIRIGTLILFREERLEAWLLEKERL